MLLNALYSKWICRTCKAASRLVVEANGDRRQQCFAALSPRAVALEMHASVMTSRAVSVPLLRVEMARRPCIQLSRDCEGIVILITHKVNCALVLLQRPVYAQCGSALFGQRSCQINHRPCNLPRTAVAHRAFSRRRFELRSYESLPIAY